MTVLQRSEHLLKILAYAVLIIFLAILQSSFFIVFPWPFNYFNLALPVIFFITIILSYKLGLWFAFFLGLIFDLFSSWHFGILTLSLLLTVVLVNFLFDNFFTNRSFYSLVILGGIGNLFYMVILLIFNLSFLIFGLQNYFDAFWTEPHLYGLLWQLVFNILTLAVFFFIFNFLSKKLKSVFY